MTVRRNKGRQQEDFDAQGAVVAMRFDALMDWLDAAGDSIKDGRHRHDVLCRAVECADPGVLTPQQRKRAEALGVPEHSFEQAAVRVPPHAVRVPFVRRGPGTGFVRLMHVAADLSVHGGYDLALEPDAGRAVADAFALAFERARAAVEPATYRFTNTHPGAFGERAVPVSVQGPSLSAAAFVSAYSLKTQRPVREGVAVTASIRDDKVLAVGGLAPKLEAILEHRPDITRLVVASRSLSAVRRALQGHELRVVGVGSLQELIDATLQAPEEHHVPIRHRVSMLRRDFEGGWHGFRWHAIRDRVERVLADVPEHCPDLRVEVMSMLGAVQAHVGMLDESLAILQEAESWAAHPGDGHGMPDQVETRLQQRISMTLRRLGRSREGRAAARRAVRAAERGRLRDERFKAHGCAGLVELAAGRPGAAAEQFNKSLTLVHSYAPESCVRTHGYLIQALCEAGDLKAAKREYTQATAHLRQHYSDGRGHSAETWLRLSYGAGLSEATHKAAALQVLDAPCVRHVIERHATPGLQARRYLATALAADGRTREGYQMLAPSPYYYGTTLEPGLLLVAQTNVLREAVLRMEHGDWNGDIRGRALSVLRRLPPHAFGVVSPELLQRAVACIEAAGEPVLGDRNPLTKLTHLLARLP